MLASRSNENLKTTKLIKTDILLPIRVMSDKQNNKSSIMVTPKWYELSK